MHEIEAFILIGGRSLRFGSDKAFHIHEGKTLAQRAAETVEAALPGVSITYVAAADDQFAGGLIFSLGRPVVSDLRPGFGAWSGLHTALSYARADLVLILACDLPLITPELLKTLAAEAEGFDTVVPQQPDGRLQPLCGVYRRSWWLPVVDELLNGRASLPPLAGLIERSNARILSDEELSNIGAPDLLRNVNRKDDLA